MKYFLLLVFTTVFFSSCGKEAVTSAQEDFIIQIMTNGQWTVTNFTKGGNDMTPDFSVYKFQFQSNRTVDAIKNSSVEKKGTWDANPYAKTITSNFVNANQTLRLLNGTWTITKTTMTTVDATQTVNSEIWTLKLAK